MSRQNMNYRQHVHLHIRKTKGFHNKDNRVKVKLFWEDVGGLEKGRWGSLVRNDV